MAVAPTVFLKEVRDELKKVTWPKQDEIMRLTFVVIAVSVVVGLYIGALDYIMTKIMEVVIK
jgi:preprotein translocase subunit SecE